MAGQLHRTARMKRKESSSIQRPTFFSIPTKKSGTMKDVVKHGSRVMLQEFDQKQNQWEGVFKVAGVLLAFTTLGALILAHNQKQKEKKNAKLKWH